MSLNLNNPTSWLRTKTGITGYTPQQGIADRYINDGGAFPRQNWSQPLPAAPAGSAGSPQPGTQPGNSGNTPGGGPPVVTPGMGFIPYYEEQRNNIARQQAGVQSQGQSELQRIQAMLGIQQHDLSNEQQRAEHSARNQLASQGILRSGITVDAENQLGQAYANRIADMQRQGAWNTEDLQSQIAQQLQQLNQQLASVNTNQARDQSAAQLEADRINAENQAAWQASQQQLAAQQPQANAQGQYQTPNQGATVNGQPVVAGTTGSAQNWSDPNSIAAAIARARERYASNSGLLRGGTTSGSRTPPSGGYGW